MSSSPADPRQHRYSARLIWEGNLGDGTASYTGYSRAHRLEIAGKPDIMASADATFLGDAERHNPEDLFLAAIAGCHMLAYLSLCSRNGIRVLSYQDEASGVLVLHPAGGGRFEEVTLRPAVTIADGCDVGLATRLHDAAHERCFIANSCSVPIRHEPVVNTETAPVETRASFMTTGVSTGVER